MHFAVVNLAVGIGEKDIHSSDIQNVSSGRDAHNVASRTNSTRWFDCSLSSLEFSLCFPRLAQATLSHLSFRSGWN